MKQPCSIAETSGCYHQSIGLPAAGTFFTQFNDIYDMISVPEHLFSQFLKWLQL